MIPTFAILSTTIRFQPITSSKDYSQGTIEYDWRYSINAVISRVLAILGAEFVFGKNIFARREGSGGLPERFRPNILNKERDISRLFLLTICLHINRRLNIVCTYGIDIVDQSLPNTISSRCSCGLITTLRLRARMSWGITAVLRESR